MLYIAKIIGLIVMLLIPAVAEGQEMVSIERIKEELGENPCWIEAYEYKNHVIDVDVPIVVPDIDEMPIVMIEPWRPFDQESWPAREGIIEIEERGGGEVASYYRYGDTGLYRFLNPNVNQEKITRVYVFKYPMDNAENYLSKDYIQIRYNSADVMLNANGKHLERKSESYYPYEMNERDVYTEDGNCTLGEAIETVHDILFYYYGEAVDFDIDYVKILERGRDKSGRVYEQNPMGSYYMHFWQKIEGSPVFETAFSIHPSIAENDELVTDLRRLELLKNNWAEIMDRERSYEVFSTLVKPQDVLYSDVPLLSAEQIIQKIEALIHHGYIRNVYSLRLGYVCYLTGAQGTGFILYPMWRVECDYLEPSEEYCVNAMSNDFRDGFDFTDIYINAQTGEMVINELENKTQLICPDIITWEDI